jgi:carbamoyl-phosphate synthase large subunit
MSKDITILTTGAGAPGAASIFKALRLGARAEDRSLRLVTCDMDSDAYGFHLADAHHIIPAGNDPAFINRIVEICQEEKPDLLFCWVDPELKAIAKNREKIEETGVRVVVSSSEAIETCLDKSLVYNFVSGLGLAPEFRFTENQSEFGDAVRALGYPQSPVCFKPVHGHGGRGFRILRSNADRAEMLFREKPDNSVTTLEDVIRLFMDTELPKLIVMEYLPGKEYTVDMLLKDGEPIITIPRERASIKLGISNIARLEKNEEIIRAAEGIARELGLDYNANIQFKMDSKGMPKLIEVQPRLAGTTAASVGAGANLPWLAAKLALGEEIEKPEVNWNTTMKRFWEEIYTDGEKNWSI